MKPRILMALGDPAGVGAELVAKLLAMEDLRERGRRIVIGDRWLLEQGQTIAGARAPVATVDSLGEADLDVPVLLDFPTVSREEVRTGEATASGGRSVLAVLSYASRLAREGRVDALVFAPLNKQALHLAGFGFEDELRWFAHELNWNGYVGELNLLEEIWTSRVTSHVPLKDVAALITEEGILDAIRLVDNELKSAGVERPRIGVAGLNPHAGDGGNFGREEIDIISPAVERARGDHIDARGPYPADTVFVRARNGEFEAVVTMYHDQGQIAMKLMGFGRGVTVLGGLPFPIATPAHGTAYDIAGQGKASPEPMRQAFLTACRMAASRRARG